MRSSKRILQAIGLALALLPFPALADQHEEYSGFLEDYSELKPMMEREGVLGYTSPDWDPKQYNKFIIPPIEIWIHPDSEYKGVQPDKLKKVSDGFRKILVEALGDDYPVVEEPGPDVVVLRIALTDVRIIKKKVLKWYSFTPAGAIATGAKKAAGAHIRLASASFEGELLNSQTGERLRAVVDTSAGEKLREKIKKGKKSPDTSWSDVEKTLKFWAKRVRERMDTARGITR
ncbi:MAG: DUF3313 domain-containing protein [Acidobacteria bacterium]|nr:DUF3313 domain-containing protein [Acidobacteriota bacterium]